VRPTLSVSPKPQPGSPKSRLGTTLSQTFGERPGERIVRFAAGISGSPHIGARFANLLTGGDVMRRFAPYLLGLALTLAPAAVHADDKYKEKSKTETEKDGDVKIHSKSKDHVTGAKTKSTTKVDGDDGDMKRTSKTKVHGKTVKEKDKVDVDDDKVKVKRKIE
jgi:hypothetical protein